MYFKSELEGWSESMLLLNVGSAARYGLDKLVVARRSSCVPDIGQGTFWVALNLVWEGVDSPSSALRSSKAFAFVLVNSGCCNKNITDSGA